MLIFLINLDRSPDRLAFMTAQLEALGLEAERLPAVEGDRIDLSSYGACGLRPGEIGCFLSHREAWRRLVESGSAGALVLEDDVRLSPDLAEVLEIAARLDEGSDILKLDTSGRSIVLDTNTVGVVEPTRFARLCSEHTGTAGYLISAAAASELLARSTTFSQPVDLFMFGKSAVAQASPRIFQAVPAVVAQEKRFRDVHDTELGSVIRLQKTSGAPVVVKVFREMRRWLRKLARLVMSVPSRVTGTRRYLRVPFA